MEVLKLVEKEAALAGKRFILIGGHAINVHGISRTTGDIDLMVEREDLKFWSALLMKLNYTIFRETSAFIQSRPTEIAAWPIDLMLVSEQTMSKALADALYTAHCGPKVAVASVGSLVAMKLHALKSNQADRMLKDQGDLLLSKYMNGSKCSANPDWANRLLDHPLELPEDPEFHSISPAIDLKQMIVLSESYLPFVNSRPDFIEHKLGRKFDEPFEL